MKSSEIHLYSLKSVLGEDPDAVAHQRACVARDVILARALTFQVYARWWMACGDIRSDGRIRKTRRVATVQLAIGVWKGRNMAGTYRTKSKRV